ncbi:MAG TPA: DUF721 domain-containing protein [Actinomycetota bacterium]|nr:DUF721 domain-containing protein [Actinomycetota bacterium]
MSERDPVRIGSVLGQMIHREGWRPRLALGRLRASWSEIVGPQIGANSYPGKLSDGVLLIFAESGAWATELALLAGRLAVKADAFLGGGLVREVKVVARGGGRASKRG